MRSGEFTRFDRFVLHGVVFATTREAVFIRTAIGHRRGDEIAVPRRRRRRPFQRGRIPRIIVLDLLPLPNAIEEIDDERNLRQAHYPGSNRDWRIPLKPGKSPNVVGGNPPTLAAIVPPSMHS